MRPLMLSTGLTISTRNNAPRAMTTVTASRVAYPVLAEPVVPVARSQRPVRGLPRTQRVHVAAFAPSAPSLAAPTTPSVTRAGRAQQPKSDGPHARAGGPSGRGTSTLHFRVPKPCDRSVSTQRADGSKCRTWPLQSTSRCKRTSQSGGPSPDTRVSTRFLTTITHPEDSEPDAARYDGPAPRYSPAPAPASTSAPPPHAANRAASTGDPTSFSPH